MCDRPASCPFQGGGMKAQECPGVSLTVKVPPFPLHCLSPVPVAEVCVVFTGARTPGQCHVVVAVRLTCEQEGPRPVSVDLDRLLQGPAAVSFALGQSSLNSAPLWAVVM